MNIGYRRLSEIAWQVYYKEDAFDLIGQAYGSVETFFELLEEQRVLLKRSSNVPVQILPRRYKCLKSVS
jgi:hypothetical protein